MQNKKTAQNLFLRYKSTPQSSANFR